MSNFANLSMSHIKDRESNQSAASNLSNPATTPFKNESSAINRSDQNARSSQAYSTMAISTVVLVIAITIATCRHVFAQNARFVKIYDIQGASHVSPRSRDTVTTDGVVTAVAKRGFYFQDPVGDNNPSTSDALFVFTRSSPTVNVADAVVVTGRVSEFTPSGKRTGNLASTQIVATSSSSVKVISSGNPLPKPVLIGNSRMSSDDSARIVPKDVIDDDAFTSFDPATDALDFYESLEAMLVTVRDPVTVSTKSRFGELWVVPDNGIGSDLGPRGALPIGVADFNPERIQIDTDATIFRVDVPDLPVGTELSSVTGVVSYNFGSFEVIPISSFSVKKASTLTPMTTSYNTKSRDSSKVLVATMNTLNLDPQDGFEKFEKLASIILQNLRKPDVIALQEVQDANGPSKGGTVSAALTLQMLVDAISRDASCRLRRSCPSYGFLDNTFIGEDTSGGLPGGNIRTAYLYRMDRVTILGDSVNSVVDPVSQQSDKSNAFYRTRLPLAVKFRQLATGRDFQMINVHFSSKGRSSPLFGAKQPADMRQEDPDVNRSVDKRLKQAGAVAKYINALSPVDKERVIVTGDFNEFEFISPLKALQSTGLTLMTNTIPRGLRYSFIFKGNAQVLDHFLVGADLVSSAQVEIVHVNNEFPDAASDHEPVVLEFEV